MGHVAVGHRWDRVAMDILDMSVTTPKGNCYVREFKNHLMQELCLLCGSHKTRTTPYHPASDGMVERFNRTLLMMLAMFVDENRDDWDDGVSFQCS